MTLPPVNGADDPVAAMLAQAAQAAASDIHLEPGHDGYRLRLRIDGVLEDKAQLTQAQGRMLVNRLMVAAKLLTYKPDVPQEGRLEKPEGRLAVMPTVHGPRAVVRLPSAFAAPAKLEELGLSTEALAGLSSFAAADSGLLVLCGPAGSGKTTTAYAVLEAVVRRDPGLSVVSVEDPVERKLTGVAQVEVKPFGELDFPKALRSLLRQDPQVIFIGEVRDSASAQIAVQAALTGHRVITSLHAQDGPGALVRLLEMGIEPYQAASALFGVLGLRLLRKAQVAGGYRGRLPVSEWMPMDANVRRVVLAKGHVQELRLAAGLQGLRARAMALVEAGQTDAQEVVRVFGM